MTVNIEPLRAANERRSAEAASRNQELAGRALAWLDTAEAAGRPEDWRVVAEARRDYPTESWGQIASRLGVSRFSATSSFRRLLVAAGIRVNGPGRWDEQFGGES